MIEHLQIRIHGSGDLPTLVYLPGIHGDWTLVSSFRKAVEGRARFVEFIYPRTLTWSLAEYAGAVQAALASNGVRRGWLLAESFGSQVAWPLVAASPGSDRPDPIEGSNGTDPAGPSPFRVEGLILAAGFVRHPMAWAVPIVAKWCGNIPGAWIAMFLVVYARYARFRHRHAPESLEGVDEFIARRTELDRSALIHRLHLIAGYDPSPVARGVGVPVHYLAGPLDPLVPWPLVRWWLRRHCPGYRGGKMFWRADHAVLATTPRPAAERVLDWIREAGGPEVKARANP